MKHEDVEIGQHCWAISRERLLIVLKINESCYEVCGGWEDGMGPDVLEIIEIIEPPSDYFDVPLYYL